MPERQATPGRSPEAAHDETQALWYLWGRMDMGEKRDVNDNWRFASAWADAQEAFRKEERHWMPSLQDALRTFDEGGTI